MYIYIYIYISYIHTHNTPTINIPRLTSDTLDHIFDQDTSVIHIYIHTYNTLTKYTTYAIDLYKYVIHEYKHK